MAALLIILAALVLLFCGYVCYGSWLAKQWGMPDMATPARLVNRLVGKKTIPEEQPADGG